jgi:hypothetical protein
VEGRRRTGNRCLLPRDSPAHDGTATPTWRPASSPTVSEQAVTRM